MNEDLLFLPSPIVERPRLIMVSIWDLLDIARRDRELTCLHGVVTKSVRESGAGPRGPLSAPSPSRVGVLDQHQ